MVLSVCDCKATERDHGEHREYERLNETNEKFETEKRERNGVRYQKCDNRKQYFTGKDIPEQSKREGDDFTKLADNFEETDKGGYGTLKRDELPEMSLHTKRDEPEEMRKRHRDKRERERHIEIGVHRAKQRNEGLLTLV